MVNAAPPAARRARDTLDPADWSKLRAEGHRLLDAVLDHMQGLAERPLWRPMPAAAREAWREPAPAGPTPLLDLVARFEDDIAPYASGNAHPGFMGWVQGAGTPAGMLGEMLSAGLNMNCGGRDHVGIEIERQVALWCRAWFGFPDSSAGIFVTGASTANFIGVLAARTAALGGEARRRGVAAEGRILTAYAGKSAHACVAQGLDLSGLGSDRLRRIDLDADGRMDLAALKHAIAADRAAGFTPFLLVGTAGTVDIGAIDDLNALADLAAAEDLWLHVDGALGALAVLSPALAPRFAGIERADSLAFDFHKWAQVPYDAGFILARRAEDLRAAFAAPAAYLARAERGLAAGADWPNDFGPDLSRSCRALKTWFTVKHYGVEALGAMMASACDLARNLAALIDAHPKLERLAPVGLNIVAFRYKAAPDNELDALNAHIVEELHLQGRVAPSLTTLGGTKAIRASLMNHRTQREDIEALVELAAATGDRLQQEGRLA
ncbi:MAG: pyridoxal-dependent decarboxylase [Pseudomonadota bacterium]|jgi:aromatic-L-amino-acid decarboxylase